VYHYDQMGAIAAGAAARVCDGQHDGRGGGDPDGACVFIRWVDEPRAGVESVSRERGVRIVAGVDGDAARHEGAGVRGGDVRGERDTVGDADALDELRDGEHRAHGAGDHYV